MKSLQKIPEDPRFTERLGPGYVSWVHDDLVPSMFSRLSKLPRDYTREELVELAWFVVTEYVLDIAQKTPSKRDVFPKTDAEKRSVRSYVATMVYNELTTRAREEDSWTCVHTPPIKSLRSEHAHSAALNASGFSRTLTHVLDDGEESANLAVEATSIDQLDPQFCGGSSAMDTSEICEMRESDARWTEEGLDFADAVEEFRQKVVPKKAGPDDKDSLKSFSPKQARRERILLEENRVNAAYLFVNVFYEKDRLQAMRAAPAMCLRWIHGVDTPAKLLSMLGSLAGGRSLEDIFEDEARKVLSWVRRYTRLGGYLREQETRIVLADARVATQGWRGAYRKQSPSSSLRA
jgi:hypothetical protein